MSDKQIFIPIGTYKGNTCAIKKINVPINLNRSLMMELKTMKDIQHDHLVRFYGAVIDSIPCILTEYCPKGSLQDILENHEINLDMMFKLSLMHDIVKVRRAHASNLKLKTNVWHICRACIFYTRHTFTHMDNWNRQIASSIRVLCVKFPTMACMSCGSLRVKRMKWKIATSSGRVSDLIS